MTKTVRICWAVRRGMCQEDDRTHREGETLAVTVRSILLVKHVVQRGDLSIRIGYLVHDRQRAEDTERARIHNRELDISGAVLGAVLVDIHNPFVVILEIIGRNTDDLDIALCKVVCATSDLAELGGADRGEVSGMREEDGLKCSSDKDSRNEEEHTQELPIHSWNLIRPAVVSAWKSGAMLPRRRAGMIRYDIKRWEQG
jgi:hypothetical protein